MCLVQCRKVPNRIESYWGRRGWAATSKHEQSDPRRERRTGKQATRNATVQSRHHDLGGTYRFRESRCLQLRVHRRDDAARQKKAQSEERRGMDGWRGEGRGVEEFSWGLSGSGGLPKWGGVFAQRPPPAGRYSGLVGGTGARSTAKSRTYAGSEKSVSAKQWLPQTPEVPRMPQYSRPRLGPAGMRATRVGRGGVWLLPSFLGYSPSFAVPSERGTQKKKKREKGTCHPQPTCTSRLALPSLRVPPPHAPRTTQTPPHTTPSGVRHPL